MDAETGRPRPGLPGGGNRFKDPAAADLVRLQPASACQRSDPPSAEPEPIGCIL